MAASSNPNETPLDAARWIALRLLAPAPLTCAQLGRKLRDRGVRAEVVVQLVDDLQNERLLDDADYARRWRERRRAKGYGGRRIVAELRARGVDGAVAEAALAEEAPDVEWDTALAAAERHAPRLAGMEAERARAKLARHLSNRGFGADTIHRFLAKIDVGDE
ncbi:MAG: regulatory protein RecX [Nitrospirota bacterium]|jgi:regulatory protein